MVSILCRVVMLFNHLAFVVIAPWLRNVLSRPELAQNKAKAPSWAPSVHKLACSYDLALSLATVLELVSNLL